MIPSECCRPLLGAVPGCSSAWHRKVFHVFGPLQPEIVFEDRVIDLRAALLGSIRHIPEPLVKYRWHGTNLSGMLETADMKQAQRTLECFVSAFRNRASDLEMFIQNIQPGFGEASQCRRLIRQRIGQCQSRLQIHHGSPGQMIRGLLGITLNGGNFLQGVKLCRASIAFPFRFLMSVNLRHGTEYCYAVSMAGTKRYILERTRWLDVGSVQNRGLPGFGWKAGAAPQLAGF